MSKNKYQNCAICNAVFKNEYSNKCHSCNLIGASNKNHVDCTSHLTKDEKHKIAELISAKKGVEFKFYNQAIPVIKKELNLDIDYNGVRSIISSTYYKSIAFE